GSDGALPGAASVMSSPLASTTSREPEREARVEARVLDLLRRRFVVVVEADAGELPLPHVHDAGRGLGAPVAWLADAPRVDHVGLVSHERNRLRFVKIGLDLVVTDDHREMAVPEETKRNTRVSLFEMFEALRDRVVVEEVLVRIARRAVDEEHRVLVEVPVGE